MRARAFLLAVGIAALTVAAPAQAARYDVTGTADPGACDGLACTGIRAAIAAAAASKGVDDEIDLKKATYLIASQLAIADGDGLAIVGAGADQTFVSGGDKARVFNVLSGKVSISHLTITDGAVNDQNGAGIQNATQLTLDHVRVTASTATASTGGGGIANTGVLAMLYSLVDGNVTAGDGGGILNLGSANTAATLSIRDSTIARNTGQIRGGFGGISTRGNDENRVDLQRVSVADNVGGSIAGAAGGLGVVSGTLNARATIVARNKLATGAPSNCSGPVTDIGSDLESGTDCGFKDKQNANPGFPDGLVDAGGETPLYTIPAGSPAVDLAPLCTGVTDQRDLGRPQGKGCDAGAYEVDQASEIATLTGPSGLTTDANPRFTFSSTEPGVSYECKLDGPGSATGAFAACTSPRPYAGLADGSYTFSVRALDGTHANPPAASLSFTVDTKAPAAPAFTSPPAIQNTGTVTIAGTAELFSKVTVVEGTAVLGTVTTNQAGVWSLPALTGVADGVHTYRATAQDLAGNTGPESTRTVTVDTKAPTAPQLNSPADNSTQNTSAVTVGGTAEAGSTVTVLDNGSALPGTVTTAANGTWSKPVTAADGAHAYTAKATDAAGNTSAESAARHVTVDTHAPAPPVVSSPTENAFVRTATPQLSGTAEGSAKITVKEGTTVRGTGTAAVGGAWSVTLTTLTQGSHTLSVTATDAATNESSATTRTIRVDTIAPVTTLERAGLPTRINGAISFTFSANETGSAFQCRLDAPAGAGSFADCTSPKGYTGLTAGNYRFHVVATDPAGNPDPTDETFDFTVDTTGPGPPAILAPAESALLSSASFTVSGSAEPGATVELFEGELSKGTAIADGGQWAIDLAGVPDGSHTYIARATDVAHNTSGDSASRTVTVDTTPPPAAVTGGPTGTTTDSAPAFSFGSDAGTTFECRLDGPAGPGAYAPCTPPKSYAGLAPGEYTFFVRAIDAAGNASAPASRSFTVTVPVQATPTPTPTYQQSVVVQPAGGKVLVRRKGKKTFVPLDAGQSIPLGSEVDTKRGKLRLSSVPRRGGPVQTALFYAGIFVVTQTAGITNLKLSEPLAACPKRASAAARKKKPKTRKLWGDGSGAFRTQGQYSAATVRGTKWLVQDSCAGTLTRVARGVVSVNDRVRHKTILLKQGKRYLAKPKRG